MNELTRQELFYMLFSLPIIPRKKREILKNCSVEELYTMSESRLKEAGFSEKHCRWWQIAKAKDSQWRKEYHSLKKWGIHFITEEDKAYPKRLHILPDRPCGLLVKGRLPADDLPSAAIIGARSCSLYGKDTAEKAGRLLAEAGVQVISGMALGIDGAGHRGALEAGGAPTYAVLGSGCLVCYPAEHRRLYEAIPIKGGILSEYGPAEQPEAWHFPMRNRLIAALSDVVIVPEAKKKSGSLITVDFALEQGKDVYVFPGRLTDPCSEGCNGLIQNGAGIVTSLEELPTLFGKKAGKVQFPEKLELGLARPEKLVYSCLDSEPKQGELIIEETGLSVQEVSVALLQLEIKGLLRRSDGNCYRKA